MNLKSLESFSPSLLCYQGKSLCFDGVSLDQIAKKVGTPFYVYSERQIKNHYKDLTSPLFSEKFQICYAVKANGNLSLLKILAQLGSGADIVSAGELFRCIESGIPENKILFSGVGKTDDEIRAGLRAGKRGIQAFNVESIDELQRINLAAQKVGRIARISFRFNPNVDPKTHPHIATGLRKNKFGLGQKELNQALQVVQTLSHIEVVGISIHIGSQISSLQPFSESFSKLKQLLRKIQDHPKLRLEFVDLGGGLAVGVKPNSQNCRESYAKLVQKHFGQSAWEKDFPNIKAPQIILEPGRTLIAQSGILLTQIVGLKQSSHRNFIVVDAGMNDFLRTALYQATHPIYPVSLEHTKNLNFKADLVGPICESADSFIKNARFSKKLSKGNLFAILNAGAYGSSMSSHYNGRPFIPEILITETGRLKLIRRKQSFDEMVALEKKPQYI